MNPPPNILLVIKSSLLFVVVLYAAFTVPISLADTDGDYTASSPDEVVVSPVSFSYDDTITVTLRGLPTRFALPPKSVTLGDAFVRIPGHGEGGYISKWADRPKSDDNGSLTFSAAIPEEVLIGPQYLVVNIENIFYSRTQVDVRPIPLLISSTTVVPHQDIWVMGRGFTTRADKNKPTYTIVETRPDGVTIGGQRVLAPHVGFPAKLGADGSIFFKLTVPELESTSTPGQVELRVTDSKGRVGTAVLTVPTPTLSTVPTSSYPGQNLTFSIAGLPATNSEFNTTNYVDLRYRYAVDSSGVRFASIPIGRYASNGTGDISGIFDVPKAARLLSSNYIDAVPTYGEGRSFSHKISGRTIKIEPTSGLPGHSAVVTLNGMPANYKLDPSNVLLGGHPFVVSDDAGPLVSDDIGHLTYNGIIPAGVPSGLNVLVWDAPGAAKKIRATFNVTEGTLNFTPSSAAPGQIVNMNSVGFDGTFIRQGTAQSVSQISGTGESWIWVDGVKLLHGQIDYPITVDKDGLFESNFAVPPDASTAAKSVLDFVSIDTAGRTSRGTLFLKQPTIIVTPVESTRGTDLTVNGTGFIANTAGTKKKYKILLDYAGIPVGTAWLDSEGAFKNKFSVPSSVAVNSTHRVAAVVDGIPSIKAYSMHAVPDSAITASPAAAPPGSEIRITGSGLAKYRQVTIGMGTHWAAPPPIFYTDETGAFEGVVTVPDGLPTGEVKLKVYAPYPTLSKTSTFLIKTK